MTTSNDPTHQSLVSFDLLPTSFRRQRRIRSVCCRWAAITFVLLAILIGMSAAVMLRAHREGRSRAELASRAGPIADLRSDCMRLRRENKQRRQWCDWVETARPDDSLLQTLASIADATDAEQTRIKVQSLQVKLPLEYPPAAASPPTWAGGRVHIDAATASDQSTQQWLQRLSLSDRVADASIDPPVEYGAAARKSAPRNSFSQVQLTATPQATRVLP